MAKYSWINEQIAVSGAISPLDISGLKRGGIDAIVDLRSECCDFKEVIENIGLKFLHIKVDDRYNPTFGQLEEIFNFAEPLLSEGKKILIHCQNGCGRAPLAAVAILAKKGMSIQEAVGLMESKHPITSFSEPQKKFIYTELDKFLRPKSK